MDKCFSHPPPLGQEFGFHGLTAARESAKPEDVCPLCLGKCWSPELVCPGPYQQHSEAESARKKEYVPGHRVGRQRNITDQGTDIPAQIPAVPLHGSVTLGLICD